MKKVIEVLTATEQEKKQMTNKDPHYKLNDMVPEVGTTLAGGGQTLTVSGYEWHINADVVAYAVMSNGVKITTTQLSAMIANGSVAETK